MSLKIPISSFDKKDSSSMYVDEIRALCNRVITREIKVQKVNEIEGPTMFAEEVKSYLRKGGEVKRYPAGNGGDIINIDKYEIHQGAVAYEF